MGAHHLNPVAQANAVPQKQVRVIDIGEGYCIAGLTLEPLMRVDSEEKEPTLAAVLSVVGGRKSDLVPMIPVKLVLGELAALPVTKLREMLAKAISDQERPA